MKVSHSKRFYGFIVQLVNVSIKDADGVGKGCDGAARRYMETSLRGPCRKACVRVLSALNTAFI